MLEVKNRLPILHYNQVQNLIAQLPTTALSGILVISPLINKKNLVTGIRPTLAKLSGSTHAVQTVNQAEWLTSLFLAAGCIPFRFSWSSLAFSPKPITEMYSFVLVFSYVYHWKECVYCPSYLLTDRKRWWFAFLVGVLIKGVVNLAVLIEYICSPEGRLV